MKHSRAFRCACAQSTLAAEAVANRRAAWCALPQRVVRRGRCTTSASSWGRLGPIVALLLCAPLGFAGAQTQLDEAALDEAALLQQLRDLEAGDGDVAEDLEGELRRQEALLRGIDEAAGPSARPYELRAEDLERLAPGQTDPRMAPDSPEPRELPDDIFDVEQVVIPKGKWDNDRDLELEQRLLDADGDGKPELVRWHSRRNGRMVREHEDANYDGVTDTWTVYEDGQPVTRVRDSNDDGTPDTWERFAQGRLAESQVDRDDDGVRDAFFRYEGRYLVEEKHDANNDGKIDLLITYDAKHRARVVEDHDKDGRFDSWTFYTVVEDRELVGRVELDRNGRGFADTFEYFEASGGEVRLVRREEDLDGDRQIDLVSHYRDGKLVRRDIAVPDLVNL